MASADEPTLSTAQAEGLVVLVVCERQVYEHLTGALVTNNHSLSFY